MRKPASMKGLEELGRVRLSPSFFMRDFLYSEISVYYELYGAATDSGGRARLRIEYEVLSVKGFDPYVGGAGYVDGELAQPLVRAVFEDDRTGTTTGGRVIRGTRLQVAELEPGDYVLIVRVSDRLARRETQNNVLFRVPAPAGG